MVTPAAESTPRSAFAISAETRLLGQHDGRCADRQWKNRRAPAQELADEVAALREHLSDG
jgi:hypothetical protein